MKIAKMKLNDGGLLWMARGMAVATTLLASSVGLRLARADAEPQANRDSAQRLSVSADETGSAARLLESESESQNITPESIAPAVKPAPERRADAAPESSADAAPESSATETPEAAREPEKKHAMAQPSQAARQTIIAQPAPPAGQRGSLNYVEPVRAEAVHFNGIQPGGSTRAELRDKWGPPKELKKAEGTTRYSYSIEPFKQVVVSVQGDRVAGIAIFLEQPLPGRPLANQLHLDDCQPVVIADAQGKPVGEAYPEHGVMFAYSPRMGAGHVQQIVLESIDAQSFLLRAESRIRQLPAHALADAEYAAQLDSKSASAHALQAKALELLGRPGAARVAAAEAMRLDPKQRAYRFLTAQLEIESGDNKAAARIMQHLLTQQPLPPLVEALAYQLWGDCLAQPRDNDFSQAIEHHQHAIRLAEPLVNDKSATIRLGARMMLVEANLAVARDVAFGHWSHKNQAAMKWLVRAKTIAEEMTSKEEADEILLLHVYETAMTVLAAAPGKTPANDWIAGLQRVGGERIAAAEESAYRAALQWRLGLALADALTVERAGGRVAEAFELGEAAAKLLADAEATIESPDRDARASRLYYRLGAIEAIERGNHRAAVSWYDKALPLIEPALAAQSTKAAKAAATANADQPGDTLVSMAVSYWETGAKEKAVRLSQQGARLIEEGVEAGTIPRTALAVPYSNLSSMLSQQGDTTLAGHYAGLAARVESAADRAESTPAGPISTAARPRGKVVR